MASRKSRSSHNDAAKTKAELLAEIKTLRNRQEKAGQSRTQNKQTEDALEDCLSKYQNLLEKSAFGFFELDKAGKITCLNPVACAIAELRLDEATGRNFTDLMDEEDSTQAHDNLQRVAAGRIDSGPREYRIKTKSGAVKEVEVNTIPIVRDGKISGFHGIVNDVTERNEAIRARDRTEKELEIEMQRRSTELSLETMERVRAQHALDESEEHFRSLAEQSPNMIFINSGAKIVFVNEQCVELMEYSREEFLSPDFDLMSIIAPEHRETIAANFSRHGRGEDVAPYEYALITKSGRRIESIINTKLIDYKGCKSILGIVTDITYRKAAEAALRKSQDRYRAISELTSDFSYCFVFDILSKKVRSEWVSGAVQRITGYSAEEIMSENAWPSIIHPDDRRTAEAYRKKVMSMNTGSIEYRIVARDGTIRWVRDQSRAEWLNENHTAMRIFGAMQDVTERKEIEQERERIEAQLRQAQKMEAIGRLAGGIAHDFNNLLTAITGYSDILLKDLTPSDPAREDIQEIRNAGDRAALLTRQLLAFSRNQPIEPRVLDINALINGVEKMLRPIIGEDVELKIDCADNLSRAKADESQIQQVILNLAVNARDAMPTGGQLAIATSDVLVTSEHVNAYPPSRSGKFVCISFRDTGLGIAPEVRGHIFEPFFTTKEEGKGTGLGLSVVYGIINQHGGWISIHSELNQGTEFKVYLPAFSIQSDTAVEHKKKILSQLRGNGQRILLVEDEASVRLFANRVLSQNNYSVVEAKTARDAREIFSRETSSFDLLFSDVVLPDMHGPQLLADFRKIKPDLKAILTSGYSEQSDAERITDGISCRFLQKPYLVEELLETLKQIFEAK